MSRPKTGVGIRAMVRFTALAATAALLISALSHGQQPPVFRAPPLILDALDVRDASVQDQVLLPTDRRPFTVRLSMGGRLRTVQLRPYDILTPDFRLLVDDGTRLREIPTPPQVTYRGELVGEPDSVVAATVVDGQLRAEIHTGTETWAVQPASDAGEGLPHTAHLVYQRADSKELPYLCATQGSPVARNLEVPAPAAAAPGTVIAELAIDADEPFYRAHGSSTTAVQNDITGILNAVDVIYNRDVGIEHQVTTIIIRTVPRYTTNNPNGLLTQFRNVWNINHTDIQRDMAHLFSGRNASATLGIANFAEVCDRSEAYGVSWSLFTSNTILRVSLTAHELGHNWGANHCDGFFDCGLMCSQLPGCNFNQTSFGSFSLLQIGLFKSSRTCLAEPPAPTVLEISPSQVTSFEPGEVTVTGSALDEVSSVTVGGVPANFTIVGGDTLRFTPPSPLDISIHQVVVSNGTGASTIDLSVVGNHPSVVEPPGITIRTIPAIYRVHTDRDWHVLLVASLSNVPSIIPEVTLGLGNQFSDMVILPLFADSSGTAQIELTIPPSVPFTFSYWQAVAFDPANLTFPLEASELVVILVH